MDFLTTLFLNSCGDIGFLKNLDLVLGWISDLKVPLLPLGPYCDLFFSREEKPSEDITGHLFLINMKGLKYLK